MPVIEAQCASILVPHDHRHISHMRMFGFISRNRRVDRKDVRRGQPARTTVRCRRQCGRTTQWPRVIRRAAVDAAVPACRARGSRDASASVHRVRARSVGREPGPAGKRTRDARRVEQDQPVRVIVAAVGGGLIAGAVPETEKLPVELRETAAVGRIESGVHQNGVGGSRSSCRAPACRLSSSRSPSQCPLAGVARSDDEQRPD